MEHIHGSYESTNRFRINPFSRQIINESEIDIAIAQYDHNSERFIFELPKVVEEHDMTLCSEIRIHYINAGSNGKANKDVYKVIDLAVSEDDPDNVTFSWLISKGATSLDGVLSFAIQFICTTDGEVNYSWSTLPFKQIKIPETYDNSEDIIEEDYSDILEQWMEELLAQFGSEIDTKLDEKISERTYTRDQIDSVLTSSKTEVVDKLNLSSLKASASGEVIRVEDVSPAELKAIAKVSSKNLVNIDSMICTFLAKNSDGSYTLTKTRDGTVSTTVQNVSWHAGTYVASYNCIESTGPCRVTFIYDDGTAYSKTLPSDQGACSTTFELSRPVRKVYIGFSSGVAANSYIIFNDFMFEEGDTATEYTPYVDPTTVIVERYGKNLAKPNLTNQTSNGYTVVANDDGTVTITGSATANVDTVLYLAFRGTDGTKLYANIPYKLSAWKDGSRVSSVGAKSILSDGSVEWGFATRRDYERTITNVYIQFTPEVGDTSCCGTYKTQIEYGDDYTDYEPYKEPVTCTPASDGTLEIDSIAPTMTLFTDKSGVNIDVKYNRDLNKAFEELYQAIISLGGNI